jgi:septal ring factor EnvC (AmiA/AmiB activator)
MLTIKGAADRIDHRSYERQGLELIPTVNLGVAAMQMERRGVQTELGNRNREIVERNKQLKQMKARIRKLEDWAKAEREKPPTLWEVFSNISKREDGKTLTNSQHIANVKLMADTLNFIDKYGIETLEDMTAAVQNLRDKHNEIKLQNAKDARRWGVLDEHIKHGENYGKHRAVYDKWRKMKEGSLRSDKYYDKHRDEITAFAAAHNYLTRVLNGNKKIPLENWKREFANLQTRYSLAKTELDSLAKEIKSVETIRRNAEAVMGVGRRQRGYEMDR